MTNELTVQNQETEVAKVLVREDENYAVVKDENGKYKRKAKFNSFSTFKAESRQDKVWLLNLYEATEGSGDGLKDHAGKQIQVADVITRQYDKINEETGELEYGVLTYLITADRQAYVTSSKSVYFSIVHIMEAFGEPSKEEPYILKVVKKKAQNGDQILIQMLG
jgi:hypothetical protein